MPQLSPSSGFIIFSFMATLIIIILTSTHNSMNTPMNILQSKFMPKNMMKKLTYI